ncbi:MMPL family transporter [Cerasicoccus fimbriatus]|uniref:MMPL family transporter n=1 Tax=Cerasicoccus fimbriatus TaxID=3014554 RepID=UPI0022B4D800|nr:MMPL family transporter [Cerasicoccus sp. TK19100]
MSAPAQRKVSTPWIAILLLIVAPLAYLPFVDWSQAFNDNILELLPEESEAPEDQAVRKLLNERLSYPVMLRAMVEGADLKQATADLRETAQQQTAFSEAILLNQPNQFEALAGVVQEHREALLFSGWLSDRHREYRQADEPSQEFIAWLAKDSASRLNTFLDNPASMGYADQIPEDPLLLVPHALESLPAQPELSADELMLWLPINVDPLTSEGQQEIEDSLRAIEAKMRASYPGYEQLASGVYDIARESAAKTKSEVSLLNIGMVVVMLALILALTRHPGFILLTAVPACVAVLWCMVAGLVIFGHIHVIAIAVASVVLGLAVDYAVHLAANRKNGNLQTAWKKVRLPLTASCLSTCYGFLFLWLSPMVAMKQVAVMVPAGMLAALLSVKFLLPWLEPIAGNYEISRLIKRPLPALRWQAWAPFALVLWISAMGYLASTHVFSDDITDFQMPVSEAIDRFSTLTENIRPDGDSTQWYVFGNSPAQLRNRIQQVSKQFPESVNYSGGDDALQQNFASQSKHFGEELKQELEQAGFEANAFQPFFSRLSYAAEWDSPQKIHAAYRNIADALHGPAQALLMHDGDHWVAVINAPADNSIPDSLTAFTRELSQRNKLNEVLQHAREGILNSAAFGLIAITLCVVVFFRKHAMRAMLVPFWSVVIGLALTVLASGAIGLLALIGGVLAFCLALDYGAFAASAEEPPSSIRISAATTFSAFLVLSLCSIPAVAQLGQVVVLTVAMAWLISELLCLPSSRQTN